MRETIVEGQSFQPHQIEQAGDGVHLGPRGDDLAARAIVDLIDLEDARQGCGLNLARHVNSSPSFTPGMAPGNLTSPARSAAMSCVRNRLKLSLR